jgi:hypothetical protein
MNTDTQVLLNLCKDLTSQLERTITNARGILALYRAQRRLLWASVAANVIMLAVFWI